MLYESHGLLLEQMGRVATLWLGFPGRLPNLLNAARIHEFSEAITAVARHPHVEILVLRSAKPAGFCSGYESRRFQDRSEAVAFAHLGRRVLTQLAELPIPTVAFLEGPCHAAGLELALACDYRLAVATPDTWLSLEAGTCWGGRRRLRKRTPSTTLSPITAREAERLGLVDLAFCQRRAKIELRSFLDHLETRTRKRGESWFTRSHTAEDTVELAEFLGQRPLTTLPPSETACVPLVKPSLCVKITNCPAAHPFAVEYLLRGGRLITDDAMIPSVLTPEAVRFRATPLELAQAAARWRTEGTAAVHIQGTGADTAKVSVAPYREPTMVTWESGQIVAISDGPAAQPIAELFASAGFSTRFSGSTVHEDERIENRQNDEISEPSWETAARVPGALFFSS